MNREEYNQCMRPYMSGSKTKEEKQHDMCIGAKVCSGKASSAEEAEKLCSMPQIPKWARALVPEETRQISCEDRIARAKQNIDVLMLGIKSGQADDVKVVAAQTLSDIFTCLPDPGIMALAVEAMNQLHAMVKGYYFKGEIRDIQKNLDIIKEVL